MFQFALSIAAFVFAVPVFTLVYLACARWLPPWMDEHRWVRPLISFTAAGLALVIGVVLMPVSDEAKTLFLGIVGLIITTMIALSSTTFVANAMAGLMLKTVKSYRTGDFIQVGDYFGRVTERRAFHTEIQTEDRDLTTLPNMYLISQPIKVVRSSGTIVSCTISLGYDIPHATLEPLMLRAVEKAELNEAFVQVLELGDFSITYRIAGLLTDVRGLLPARSRLRKCVLDTLHSNDIEIVSPTFMYQRPQPPETRTIPEVGRRRRRRKHERVEKEINNKVVFGKAELAEKVDILQPQKEMLRQRLAAQKYDVEEWNTHDSALCREQMELDQARIEAIDMVCFCHRREHNEPIARQRLKEIESQLLLQQHHNDDELDKILLEAIDLIVRGKDESAVMNTPTKKRAK